MMSEDTRNQDQTERRDSSLRSRWRSTVSDTPGRRRVASEMNTDSIVRHRGLAKASNVEQRGIGSAYSLLFQFQKGPRHGDIIFVAATTLHEIEPAP